MNCTHQDFEDGIRVIRLSGRMDIEGNDEIALRLTVAARTEGAGVIVDLAGVDFLASVGIGTLVRTAQSVQQRRGRMALCGANEQVRLTLQRVNMSQIIPIYGELGEARAAIAAPSVE